MLKHAPGKPLAIGHADAAAAMLWPRLRAAALAALTAASWSSAQADNLVELLQTAKTYDAAYLSAKAQAESVQYQVNQAYALRRPSVNLQAGVTRSHLDSDVPVSPIYKQFLGIDSNNASSTSRKVGLALRQPLYNAGNAAKIDQAELALVASEADLKSTEDDLTTRLAQAYFDVLGAQDVLATTQANKKALAEQLAAAKRSFEVGSATITDTRETQARHDLAAAQEIAANNDLNIKHITLDQLVGRANTQADPLCTPVTLDQLATGTMDDWVALTSNAPAIRKAEVGLNVAKAEIAKAKAGNLPTLDAVANLARNNVDSSSSTVRTSAGAGTSSSIGLELNVALYAGNAVQNRISEVLMLQEKAEHDLDNARRSVALGTRQAYSGVQSGLAQVKAYEAAEASAKLALEATQLGYRVGVRINKDVLDAQTQLTSTRKDLYKARYDVIVGTIKLRQASGSLKAEDLIELNKLVSAPAP
jgi:outer membrane protein